MNWPNEVDRRTSASISARKTAQLPSGLVITGRYFTHEAGFMHDNRNAQIYTAWVAQRTGEANIVNASDTEAA